MARRFFKMTSCVSQLLYIILIFDQNYFVWYFLAQSRSKCNIISKQADRIIQRGNYILIEINYDLQIFRNIPLVVFVLPHTVILLICCYDTQCRDIHEMHFHHSLVIYFKNAVQLIVFVCPKRQSNWLQVPSQHETIA